MSQLHVSETSTGSFPPTEVLPRGAPTPVAAGWSSGNCSASSEGRGPLPVGSHKKSTEAQVMPQATLSAVGSGENRWMCGPRTDVGAQRRRGGKGWPQSTWLAVPPTTSLHRVLAFPSASLSAQHVPMSVSCVCLRMESLLLRSGWAGDCLTMLPRLAGN